VAEGISLLIHNMMDRNGMNYTKQILSISKSNINP